MSLINKLRKNSTIRETEILTESKFFSAKDMIQTPVPMINVALSGRLDGGLTPGLTVFAGPSKHFKTAFAMLLAKSYLEKYEDAAILFYDSEFGAPAGYFKSFGIDTDRVIHTPITDIEQLKHDMMSQINNIERHRCRQMGEQPMGERGQGDCRRVQRHGSNAGKYKSMAT